MKCICPPPLLNPGDLIHRITIQSYTDSQGTDGALTRSYSTFVTARAAINPLRGRELIAAQQSQSETTTKITMWYRSGITTKMRILFEGVYYNILSIVDVEMRHRVLELMCASGLSDEA